MEIFTAIFTAHQLTFVQDPENASVLMAQAIRQFYIISAGKLFVEFLPEDRLVLRCHQFYEMVLEVVSELGGRVAD